MHRVKFLVIAIAIFALGTATAALADTRANTDQVLATGTTVNDDYFAAARTVTINGTVNGDVYAAGATININGTVNGDVLAAGGTVNVGGKVTGSIRGAAGTMTLSGEVDRNVTVAGGTVNLQQSASVHGNVLLGSGSAIIAGTVGGNVKASTGSLDVQGAIAGNMDVRVDGLNVASSAHINGYLTYTSANSARIDSGSQIGGSVVQHLTPARPKANQSALRAGFQLWLLASELLLGVAVVALLPRAAERVADTLALRPWLSIGVGFAALISAPFALLLLAFTLVGLPLALLGGIVYALALMLSGVVVGLWLGRLVAHVAHWKLHPVVSFVLGATILWALSLLPLVGVLVAAMTVILGLGAVTISLTSKNAGESIL